MQTIATVYIVDPHST